MILVFAAVCTLAASAELPNDNADSQNDELEALILVQLGFDMRHLPLFPKGDKPPPFAVISEHKLSKEQTSTIQKEALASPLAAIPPGKLSGDKDTVEDEDKVAGEESEDKGNHEDENATSSRFSSTDKDTGKKSEGEHAVESVEKILQEAATAHDPWSGSELAAASLVGSGVTLVALFFAAQGDGAQK